MNIIVTGGAGYKGSVLVPKLRAAGHNVLIVDAGWFGPPEEKLGAIKADVRQGLPEANGADVVIHLAGVANDPCSNLNPALTWECGALGTYRVAEAAVKAGVKHFIFASSASVYGVKKEPNVTEDLEPVPLTTYNQAKMVSERILLSYADRMAVTIVRPATVCGLSPRMRLDVAVNLLTYQALSRGKITVLGGNQYRPNIHIDDITDLYCWLVDHPEITGIYNAGGENMTIRQIAELVAKSTGAEIVYQDSNDARSYRLDSSKLERAGFKVKKTVADAINEITTAYKDRTLVDDDTTSRVNWMRSQGIK